MTDPHDELLAAFETHSVDRIRSLLDAGLDPRTPVRGKRPIEWLTEMYTRSTRFPECLRLLLDRGAALEDPAVAPVLLDDDATLRESIEKDPGLVRHRTTMISAFTPLIDAPLLHVAVEYGSENAARTILERGADVDARAGVDENGLSGHTALFHAVASRHERSGAILRLLLEAGASCELRIAGLTWGKGFEWESTFFDLTPISYAQLGLVPQMQRDEREIYEIVRVLLTAAGRRVPPLENVPNRYRNPKTGS